GRAINDTIQFPDGTSVSVNFATGSRVERVSGTGLTINAAGILKVTGDVTFALKPSGRVDVDVSSAAIELWVPISGSLTKVFSLGGHANFSFGGDTGFQLSSLSISSISLFGQTLQLTPSTNPTPPVAELSSPFDGQNIKDATLNTTGHIDVLYT